ncbi:MAG: hypothetical protein R3D28_21245 [Geminicoccaceae bacterium]
MRSRVQEADQDMFEAQAAAGRLPRYVGAYMHEGEPHFSVVFASSMAGGVGFHGMSSQAYQDRFEQQTGQGRRTRVVSAFDGASTNHRFVGIWK